MLLHFEKLGQPGKKTACDFTFMKTTAKPLFSPTLDHRHRLPDPVFPILDSDMLGDVGRPRQSAVINMTNKRALLPRVRLAKKALFQQKG